MASKRSWRWATAGFGALALGALAYWSDVKLQQEAAFLVDKEVAGMQSPGYEARGKITVARDFLFIGTARAKVEVYLLDTAKQEPVPAGYEFYYTKVGSTWVLDGSGRCTSERCAAQGKQLFDVAQGVRPTSASSPK